MGGPLRVKLQDDVFTFVQQLSGEAKEGEDVAPAVRCDDEFSIEREPCGFVSNGFLALGWYGKNDSQW